MKTRNPNPTADDLCAVCGRPYAETHEVFYGSGKRQLSIKHGMQVRLCGEHHRGARGPHMDHLTDVLLKREYQAIFEERMMRDGFEPDEARDSFMRIFGRNYI